MEATLKFMDVEIGERFTIKGQSGEYLKIGEEWYQKFGEIGTYIAYKDMIVDTKRRPRRTYSKRIA